MKSFDTREKRHFLVTGSAGFVGFSLCRLLIENGDSVTGIDSMNEYYDVKLKRSRVQILQDTGRYHHVEQCLEEIDIESIVNLSDGASCIIHLAAQAGVRYSLENPGVYISSNVVGTFKVMELARSLKVKHLLFASTSSVYGASNSLPLSELDNTRQPLTIYAATKKAAEVLLHSYSHLWQIPTTVFRFFTVYGPWGRPDMALFKFVERIKKGEAIEVYNRGQMKRDFTYIDDLISSIVDLIPCIPDSTKPVSEIDSISPIAPYRIVNIAKGSGDNLMSYVRELEGALGIEAKIDFLPMQKGDVVETEADNRLLIELTGRAPRTEISHGIKEFVAWFEKYYE